MLTETLPEKKSEYIPTLDGWRAVAIMLVLVSHAFTSHRTAFGYDSHWKRAIHAALSHAGSTGVLLFFSISGFLICSRLLSDGSLKRFYIRRIFRILPPSFSYLLVIALLASSGLLPLISKAKFGWTDWASAAGFVLNYNFHRSTQIIEHFWSLAVEEQFYIFWPGILLLLGRRRAAQTALGIALAAIIWRICWLHSINNSLAHSQLLKRTDVRLDSFMFPCAIAIALTVERYRNMFRYLGDQWIGLCVILAILAIGAGSELFPIASLLEKAAIPALLTLLVVGTVMNPAAYISRLLETPWIRWLGRLSYSLYLWQEIVIYREAPVGANMWTILQLFLLRLPLLLALSLASYYWIEVPFIRIGRRLAGMRGQPASDHRQEPAPMACGASGTT